MLAATVPALVPGAIVLLHDGPAPGARRTGCEETMALIPRLAEAFAARGLVARVPAALPPSPFPPPRGGSAPVPA